MERVARMTIAEQTGRGAGGIPSCAVHPQNSIAVGAHFGPARQGPGRDAGKVTQLVERMAVREGVSESK
jgi:hypothetical protein